MHSNMFMIFSISLFCGCLIHHDQFILRTLTQSLLTLVALTLSLCRPQPGIHVAMTATHHCKFSLNYVQLEHIQAAKTCNATDEHGPIGEKINDVKCILMVSFTCNSLAYTLQQLAM